MQNIILMMKDTPVMRINTSNGLYDVLNFKLIPYQMKSIIWSMKLEEKDSYTREELLKWQNITIEKYELFISFLSARVLTLDRKNAKKILMAFHLEQSQSKEYRAKVAIICRAVSLQDNYWIKLEGEKERWSDVDIRQNSLSEVVAQVALHGSSLTLGGAVHTPELTTHGTYAKCWRRTRDGLYLYKRGGHNSEDSHIEVEVSNILDKTNVMHVKYYDAESRGKYCCKCKCMTTENISILSAMDFFTYCNRNGYSANSLMYSIDADSIYKMFIVDYLISNNDRHGMNWGFFYNCDTMDIIGCHPLFDHNGAFDEEALRKGVKYMFGNGRTLLQCAKTAITRVDFRFTDRIKKSDFYYKEHYKQFIERCAVLGLRTK